MSDKKQPGFLKSSWLSSVEKHKLSSVYIEMSGNREVCIDGCKGILEYDDALIRISVNHSSVAVKGRNLSIKCLSQDSVVISGIISSVEFEGESTV